MQAEDSGKKYVYSNMQISKLESWSEKKSTIEFNILEAENEK